MTNNNAVAARAVGTALLESTLAAPDAILGRIEGNVEAKALAPALAALGWNLATEVHWQFQMRAVPSALSADAVLADDRGVWAACETKALGALTDASRLQVLGYRDALSAPTALLTDGVRWVVWDATHPEPTIDVRASGAEQLLAHLAPHLDREVAAQRQWRDRDAWLYGRGMVIGLPAGAATAAWDPTAYTDPVTAAFVRALAEFVERNSPVTSKDAVGNRLYVRVQVSGRRLTLVEYPPTGKVVRRREVLSGGVPEPVLETWFRATAAITAPEDVDVAVAALEGVISALGYA